MSARPHTLALPLLLGLTGASGCGVFAGPNWMSASGDFPFNLGKVQSALWMEEVDTYDDSDVYGRGDLLMISEEVDCDDLLEDKLEGDPDSPIWEASGLLLSVRYSAYARQGSLDTDDYDFEGDYWSGVDIDVVGSDVRESRYWYGGLFAEGTYLQTYEDKGLVRITEHSGDEVIGRIDAPSFRARFRLENCGAPEPEDWDTGWGG